MFNWLREWYQVQDESLRCKSCETLRQQLEIANYEKKVLLEKVLHKDETPQVELKPHEVVKPRMIPWNVRRQMLEAEDRERAKLMREVPAPSAEDVKEFEKELNDAEKSRQ